VKHTFTFSEEDWKMLMDASAAARSTPVMLVAGRDVSADAHKRVMSLWNEMAEKYGFIPSTVEAGDESQRQIQAEPATDRLNQLIERHDRGAT
jgi:cobalamin biosynthesis Co2+ chelatase CbiK